MNTITMTATEAIAECNQLLRRVEELDAAKPDPTTPDLIPITRRQRAAIAKLMELAMPEAAGQTRRDVNRRHRW